MKRILRFVCLCSIVFLVGCNPFSCQSSSGTKSPSQQDPNAELKRDVKNLLEEREQLERTVKSILDEKEELKRQVRAVVEERENKRKELEQWLERVKKHDDQRREQQGVVDAILRLATSPGATYVGIMENGRGKIGRLRLVFTEQDGFLLGAVATDPDHPKEKREFIGKLNFNTLAGDEYPIVLSPAKEGEHMIFWDAGILEGFFNAGWGQDTLKLRLTEQGLEGKALEHHTDLSSGLGLTITLKREGKTGSGPPKKKSVTEGRLRE